MKKLSIFFAITALFLASCSDISDGPDSVQLAGEKKVTVSLSLSNALSRTIMPSNLTESDIDKVELTAEISTLGTYGKYSFDSGDSKTWESLGEAQESSFTLDIGTYNFTLNLYAQERIIQTKTIKDVEILESGTVLEFGTAEYAQNSGKLSLTFEWTTENLKNQLFDVKPGLYEFDEDGKIGTALIEPQLLTATTDDNKNYKATFAPEDEIPNGSYFLKVQIMSKEEEPGATPKVLNTITDIVKIKGYKTEKTIPLGLDKLNWSGKPAFEVSIKVDEESDIEVTDNLATLTNTELKFTASEGFEEYTWTVDGLEQDSYTKELTLDASDWSSGVYEIYLRAKKDGEYYSYTAQITWTRMFTVTFESTEGEVSPQYFLEGGTEKVQVPTEVIPTYGWYLDSDYKELYDFDTAPAPSSDLTLYACWNITEIYVSESGENESGRGTMAKPLASLSAALALIDDLDDPSEDYTIYIDGTLTGAQELGSDLNGKATSITLTGKNEHDGDGNPTDCLNGGFTETTQGKTLTISTSVPVTIEKLKITGGWADGSGGGLSVETNADVTLGSGILITGNHASNYGGGVNIDGILTMMEGSYIKGNISHMSNGGGGVYIYTTGTLDMQGGIIADNELLTDGSTDPHYNGVRVSGTMKMGGSASVAQNNDVYLDSEKVIEITKIFDGDRTTAAVITPDDYTRTTALITGVNLEAECKAFKVTRQEIPGDGTHMWRINEEGKLQEMVNVDAVCDQITALTENTIVTVSGYVDEENREFFSRIYDALLTLYSNYPEVKVTLDLSGVEGITEIPFEAFFSTHSACLSLSNLILPEGVTKIGDVAFRESGLESITLPSTLEEFPGWAFLDCDSLKSVTLREGNETYKQSADGKALYTSDEKKLVLYCDKTDTGSFEVPATVETIGEYAFQKCQLGTITFESNETLKILEKAAFEHCSKLTSITLPGTLSELGSECVFYYCTSLRSITIPDNVKTLTYLCFADCTSLTTIVLPDSLETIELNVFDTTPALTTVNFKGTEEQKEALLANCEDETIKSASVTWVCGYTGD